MGTRKPALCIKRIVCYYLCYLWRSYERIVYDNRIVCVFSLLEMIQEIRFNL